MKTAVGCIILCADTSRILYQLRAPDNRNRTYWGFWGGKAEPSEMPIQTVTREITEEIGFLPEFDKMYPIHTLTNDNESFVYITMLMVVDREFLPSTNSETSGYAWLAYDYFPAPLHPGVKVILHSPKIFSKISTIINGISQKAAA
jgi:8-oxo-dGTP pyrophosphatase MutT (NUDIX family)